ncbi:MAG: hypothetical protein DRJ18_00275 [Candidatus Methanomethylicota archaeon]|nr:MAG: hypothetical protein DRJ18_00275 [Candidatus Verstraetearchaeota archaeon]
MVTLQEIKRYIKEKILLVGNSGTGKTYCCVKIAVELSKLGHNVVYIDPEFGSQREFLRYTDDELANIDLRVVDSWTEFKNAVLEPSKCTLKIVDGLSEVINLHQKYLMDKWFAQGYVDIGDKRVEIKDPDSFRFPWNLYPTLYDEVRHIIYELLYNHSYHFLMTMHPLQGTEAKERLQEDLFRKFDCVIELRRLEGDTPNWEAIIRKNRGKEDHSTVMRTREHDRLLVKRMLNTVGGSG